MKRLSARDKAEFYEQLAALLESGIPIAKAVGMVSDHTARATARAAFERCSLALAEGRKLSDAMGGEPGAWEAFEASVFGAGEESGRMAPLAVELGRYWRTMDETGRLIVAGSVYPLLILHVAILAGNVPTAVTGGLGAFARGVGIALGALYSLAWFLWEFGSSGAGRKLSAHMPVIGEAQSSLRSLRCALCLRLQIEAGVPILTALPRAARAAGGASLGREADEAVKRLRSGEPASEVLPVLFAGDRRMPALLVTGVESGRLGAVLRAIEEDAARRWREAMGLVQLWLPRIVYFAAMAFAVWQISRLAGNIYGTYSEAVRMQ